nr:MAG TPA: hypothetical protein [Caudoviricetes sp.]
MFLIFSIIHLSLHYLLFIYIYIRVQFYTHYNHLKTIINKK